MLVASALQTLPPHQKELKGAILWNNIWMVSSCWWRQRSCRNWDFDGAIQFRSWRRCRRYYS